jgi:hypothetical protein
VTYELTLWVNTAASGHFWVTARFGAWLVSVHGVCAYLMNLPTGQMYAEVGKFWTNHK